MPDNIFYTDSPVVEDSPPYRVPKPNDARSGTYRLRRKIFWAVLATLIALSLPIGFLLAGIVILEVAFIGAGVMVLELIIWLLLFIAVDHS